MFVVVVFSSRFVVDDSLSKEDSKVRVKSINHREEANMLIGLVRDSVMQCFCHTCRTPTILPNGKTDGKDDDVDIVP